MLDMNIHPEENIRLALGRHITIEYYECDHYILLSKDIVEQSLLKAASESGATVVNSSFHDFSPQGVSGVVIISESHFTIHTWPEHDYAAVDIFTCGDSINFETAINSIQQSLGSRQFEISSDLNRGLISKPSYSSNHAAKVNNAAGRFPVSWKKDYDTKQPWGISSSIDIYNCDPGMIRDSSILEQFVQKLCGLIAVKQDTKYPGPVFNEDPDGKSVSVSQHIGTSHISGYFNNTTGAAYIDVFSCSFYEPREAAEFTVSFLKGSNYKLQVGYRY